MNEGCCCFVLTCVGEDSNCRREGKVPGTKKESKGTAEEELTLADGKNRQSDRAFRRSVCEDVAGAGILRMAAVYVVCACFRLYVIIDEANSKEAKEWKKGGMTWRSSEHRYLPNTWPSSIPVGVCVSR